MSIVVIGATGKLGSQVVRSLIARGVRPDDIVAGGRNVDRLAELSAAGVRTARVDLDEPRTLEAAMADATAVLLISANGNPQRVEQHERAIAAASAASVELLAYTSFVQSGKDADHADHEATERLLGTSDVPYVILRNGVYFSYFERQIPGWVTAGEVVGAAGSGRISAGAHADLADAAAAVLTEPGHVGECYELGIDEAFTLAGLATELSRQTGRSVSYRDLSVAAFRDHLIASGMPDAMATRRANVDRGMADQRYEITSGDLRRLIGRAPVSLAEAIDAALR